MKILRYTIYTIALVVGFSVNSMAQKGDQKDPPPKKDPPVVVVKDKDKDKPKNDDRGKDNKGKKPD